MIVKQGKVREWHFAHKTLSENCSHESYLHSLAKIKIHDWFYRADQFMLGLNTEFKCSHIDSCIWFDIGILNEYTILFVQTYLCIIINSVNPLYL